MWLKSQISRTPPLISSHIFNHFQKFKVPPLCKLFHTVYSFISSILLLHLNFYSICIYIDVWIPASSPTYQTRGFNLSTTRKYVQACLICLSNWVPKLVGWFWGYIPKLQQCYYYPTKKLVQVVTIWIQLHILCNTYT